MATHGLGPDSRVGEILRQPRARPLLEGAIPGLADSYLRLQIEALPLARVLEISGMLGSPLDESQRRRLLDQLGDIEPLPRVGSAPPVRGPESDYEPTSVARGSASVTLPEGARGRRPLEIGLQGPSHGNPFVDVELTAEFRGPDDRTLRVGGFYDGDGWYRLRLLPDRAGAWSFRTRSNARSLDAVEGVVEVGAAAAQDHGVVRVSRDFHFAYEDGTPYVPVGTTAYAWTCQPAGLQEQTLRTLAQNPFNKMRMGVFPKHYQFNANEPPSYPFAGSLDAGWDLTRFSPGYFQALEGRIDDLYRLGIQTDLILFHPYDRWGFSVMDPASDDRYVRYLVRRLAAFPSVWWALANEWDLLFAKSVDDWERLAGLIRAEDPYGHLMSIHNCVRLYDHSRPWITHCSLQRLDVYRTAENVAEWREQWGKPVVVDECAYEGDIDQGWGNISGQEMTRRAWEGAVRGGYVAHGETYLNDREELWWSKGGELVGDSPARLGFLARIIGEAPQQSLDPLPSEWDLPWGGSEQEYRIAYFGFQRPRFRIVHAPAGRRYEVAVIDTWAMTVERVPGVFEGTFRVELPARPYLALRLRAVE